MPDSNTFLVDWSDRTTLKPSEEGEPERIVLVHVQSAGHANRAARGLIGLERRVVVEQALGLVLEQVRDLVLLVQRITGTALAAITGDETTMTAGFLVHAEVVDGKQAAVRAALAARGAMRGIKRGKLVNGKKRGCNCWGRFAAGRVLASIAGDGLVKTVARQKSRAIRAHVAGDVGAHGIHACELFEGAKDRVVQERAALHDDMLANVVRVADLDNLEQRVLDDGNSQAGGDVANRGTFLLSLLDAAVHEYSAATAQVNGIFGRIGGFCEVGNLKVQAACEAFDEAAAARRAGFVQHDVVDDAVFDAQTLHVLAANVQNELDVGHHFTRAAQMRDGLDFAGVNAQGLQQQSLTVAGYRGMADVNQRPAGVGVFRQVGVQLGERILGAPKNVALVADVMGP